MTTALDVIVEYKDYGLTAMLFTVFATPIAAAIAKRFGVLDHPDQKLKPHAQPTPYLGGAAICLGWSAALIFAMVSHPEEVDWRVVCPIMFGGIAMSILGLFDDLRDIAPKLRLAIGALVIIIVMLLTGAGQELAASFLQYLHLHPSRIVLVPISFILGLFIVLGACNSTNLIDGLDGLCPGVTAIISIGFFVLATHLAVVEHSREDNATRLVLSVAMLGATLGFLPFNFNPAKIFMGDAGSVLLGFNCGVMILLFDERGQMRWMLAGLMVFALPILDTALAIIRRWRSGHSIFVGDRSHFYDQLVDRGMSVRKVVFISYALAALFAMLGCSSIFEFMRLRYSIVLYAFVMLSIAYAVHKSGMIQAAASDADFKSPPPDSPPANEGE